MQYHVILIEYGRPTHHWVYTEVSEAIKQLELLNSAFWEVNEVFATLVKAGYSSKDYLPDQLIQSMIIPPRTE